MRNFLFLTAILIGLANVSAQEYDEVDLLGTWNVTSQKGDISNTFKSFEKITFGEAIFDKYYRSVDQWEYQESYPVPLGVVYGATDKEGLKRPTTEIRAFSIPNLNKLHILIVDREELAMYFIIRRFTDGELVLSNYKGTCEITLTKESASRVAELEESEKSEKEYYSINGMKVNNPDQGIYIEKEGAISKVVVK